MTQEILEQAIFDLEKKYPEYSTHLFFNKKRRFIHFFSCLFLFSTFVILYPSASCLVIFISLNFLYLIVQVFKVVLFVIGVVSDDERTYKEPEELPIYSILVPLYKEDKVLKKLVRAIEKIDYPQNLLEVKLLIEEDDCKTIEALSKILLPTYFEVIQIPFAYPRTKPKACNYGLKFTKGKYVVVYDAEDRPHPQQLKQVIAKFSTATPEVICIQAKLNFYNKRESLITKFFSIEYSVLFDYFLRGLTKLNMPIPLGGTSNHFIREKLQKIGAWDPFNVTEDAEIGIRLYSMGYKIDLINSYTLEESPIEIKAWLVQRSRWIKGHFLTSLLYIKNSKNISLNGILGVYLFLFLPNLIYLLLPFYLCLRIFVDGTEQFYWLWKINLLLGVTIPVSYALFIVMQKKWKNFTTAIIYNILYYWLSPIAALRSCWQIFFKPFYWDKTDHGVSKNYEE